MSCGWNDTVANLVFASDTNHSWHCRQWFFSPRLLGITRSQTNTAGGATIGHEDIANVLAGPVAVPLQAPREAGSVAT